MTGGSRKLENNEKLYNLYSSTLIINLFIPRRMIRMEHVARIRFMRNTYNILIRKPEWKRQLGRPRHNGCI